MLHERHVLWCTSWQSEAKTRKKFASVGMHAKDSNKNVTSLHTWRWKFVVWHAFHVLSSFLYIFQPFSSNPRCDTHAWRVQNHGSSFWGIGKNDFSTPHSSPTPQTKVSLLAAFLLTGRNNFQVASPKQSLPGRDIFGLEKFGHRFSRPKRFLACTSRQLPGYELLR